MTAYSTSFVKDIYGEKDRYDYIVLNTGNIVVVDFNINEEKRNELIESGYNQTIDYFKKLLPEKKQKLMNYYKKIHKHLTQIEKYIADNKIYKTKIQIGELYMDLCEFCHIIDKTDFETINRFKNILIQNIKYPSLFGKVKLKNDKLVKAELNNLSNIVKNKIEQYNEYLVKFAK